MKKKNIGIWHNSMGKKISLLKMAMIIQPRTVMARYIPNAILKFRFFSSIVATLLWKKDAHKYTNGDIIIIIPNVTNTSIGNAIIS